MKFIYTIIFILLNYYLTNVVVLSDELPECKINTAKDCSKEKPCLWSEKDTWSNLEVPTREDCTVSLSGRSNGEPNVYITIDINVDNSKIVLQQNVIVNVEIIPSPGVTTQSTIDLLKVTQSNIIFHCSTPKEYFNIRQLELLDKSNLEISSCYNFKINGTVTVHRESSEFKINNSKIDFDVTVMIFDKKPIFQSSEISINFISPINKDECQFTDGISSLGLDSKLTIYGACKLSGKSIVKDFIRSGAGFELMDFSELTITGEFDNQEDDGFELGNNSNLIFNLGNTDSKDNEKSSEPSEIELSIKHLKFRGLSGQIMINETSNQYKSVTIDNIKGGVLVIGNVVGNNGTIAINGLDRSTISSGLEANSSIIISNSLLRSFTAHGAVVTKEPLSLKLDRNVTLIKNMTIVNGVVEFGHGVTFGVGCRVLISSPKTPVDITGDLTMLAKSNLIIDELKRNIVISGVNSKISLFNASISCYNLTMSHGTLYSFNQSTINTNNLNLYGNSSIDIPAGNENKLYVNGNLNIYSKDNKISISKLGKISSWLLVSRDCLLGGELDLHFTNIEPQSEYHILSCASGKYSNSFNNVKLYINQSTVESSTFQVEPRTNALYLLYKEENYKIDEAEKTFSGWTVFTAILISAVALGIISFYLFYKKKFRFRKQSYVPVEMDIMMKDTDEEDQY